MNAHWTEAGRTWPLIEFHDLRCERGGREAMIGVAGLAGTESFFSVMGEPDRLVMIRGFSGMDARREVLTQIHAGPAWAERRRSYADLLREGSVRLVRTLSPERNLNLGGGARPLPCVALVSDLRFPEQIGNYHLWLRLLLRKAGLDPIASFATLEAENDVPSVPVRRYRSEHVGFVATDAAVPELPRELRAMLRSPPEILRLEPVRQAALRAG
ncbi:MAG: hypothetical protein ABL866_09545 [Devosia sp.]